MRNKPVLLLALLLALIIAVPALTSCETIATYLIYEWIDDEFGDNEDPEDPVIKSISIDRDTVYTGDTVILEVSAEDDEDSESELDYLWVVSGGSLSDPSMQVVVWTAPSETGKFTITVIVTDSDDNQDTATVDVDVQTEF